MIEVKDEPLDRGAPSEVLQREGERLARSLGDWPFVLFDRTGDPIDSPGYAELLARLLEQPPQRLALVIGGALGTDDAIAGRARRRLALGAITLPHQLARVVVAEQTYRAFTLLHGEPYHR